jgi:hypothetical protein
LGTALQHSVPIGRRYANPLDPSTKFIDPVERYMDYEYQPRNMNRLIKNAGLAEIHLRSEIPPPEHK